MTAEQYESGGQLNKMAKGNQASLQRQGKSEADESAPAVKQDDGAAAAASDDSTVMSIA